MGTLFLVATPIGNLKDITLRAIETLQTVSNIACEDTRRTGQLLHILNISNKPTFLSYYDQNEMQRIPQIVQLLLGGNDVALVSDAGTPLISDPGYKLVRFCLDQGIKVEAISGPTSVITALSVSGLPTDKFFFVGYPPKKEGHRKDLYRKLATLPIKTTIVMFEAPHRLLKTLEELKEAFGDMQIAICRELTKVHEEVRREKISEALTHFQKKPPKGEFVLLFQSNTVET